MKKLLVLVSVLFTFCFCACTDESVTIEDSLLPMTRAIVNEANASKSNPDLLYNWENMSEVVLNTAITPEVGDKVTLPWANGAQTLLPQKFCEDIKKKDGWKMLFHTFKEVGSDTKIIWFSIIS